MLTKLKNYLIQRTLEDVAANDALSDEEYKAWKRNGRKIRYNDDDTMTFIW